MKPKFNSHKLLQQPQLHLQPWWHLQLVLDDFNNHLPHSHFLSMLMVHFAMILVGSPFTFSFVPSSTSLLPL
jgi:hypothetical protein